MKLCLCNLPFFSRIAMHECRYWFEAVFYGILCLLRLEIHTDIGIPVNFLLRNTRLNFFMTSDAGATNLACSVISLKKLKSQCRRTIVTFLFKCYRVLFSHRSLCAIKNGFKALWKISGWCPWAKAASPVRDGVGSYISVPINLQWWFYSLYKQCVSLLICSNHQKDFPFLL